MDRRAQRQHRGWPIGRRIVVGDRSAQRAAVLHLPVADDGCEVRERGNARGDFHRRRHFRVARHRADRDRRAVALDADAAQIRNLREVDEVARLREPELHRREQRLPAREVLRVALVGGDADRLLHRGGIVIAEAVHAGLLD